MVSIPKMERPGYEIRPAPRFSQALQKCETEGVNLGPILDRGNPIGADYVFPISKLDSHGLIAGTTGSGKTNTVFHILRTIHSSAIPFLVIEPTKTEYRSLLDDASLGPDLSVFTLGEETIAPFRLNPFEVVDGVPVQTHLDRLKAVFNASFTMYAPMPQVLERAMNEIYEDFGWNLVDNTNARAGGIVVFPTLRDLYAKIGPIVQSMGYDADITADVSAALKTRINSLCIGAKGLMLNTSSSVNFTKLLSRPTILELDAIGDDDEKAFLVGLIFLKLAETVSSSLRASGPLRHLTVVEEAHRLFQNIPLVAGSEVGNPRGKAIDTFCNILAEIRAFGEGVLVIDQIPVRLAPDTLKNTNLKIMHRLPAAEDRQVLGATMVQTQAQLDFPASLDTGRALVYLGGQHGSYEVAIPFAKMQGGGGTKIESDKRVAMRMESNRALTPTASASFSDRQLRTLEDDPEFVQDLLRFIQSTGLRNSDHQDVIALLVQHVARNNPAKSADVVFSLLRVVQTHALEQLGLLAEWPFDFVASLTAAFLTALGRSLQRFLKQAPEAESDVDETRRLWDKLAEVPIYPYPQCGSVCPNFMCRHRWVARALASSTVLKSAWTHAAALQKGDELWGALADVVDRAVERGLSRQIDMVYRRQFGLCFAIQTLHADPTLESSMRWDIFKKLAVEFDKRHTSERLPVGMTTTSPSGVAIGEDPVKITSESGA